MCMKNTSRGHYFNVLRKEFESIVSRFPEKESILREVCDFQGVKVLLPLDDITEEVEDKLGEDLFNEIIRIAYRTNEKKFLTYFYQLNEILNLPKSKVKNILEVGKGKGIFDNLVRLYDYEVKTLDLDSSNQPDIVGDIRSIPLDDNSIDLVCAFEVLEHLPFEYFEIALKEMRRCSKSYVYLSLPSPVNHISFHFQFFSFQRFLSRLSCCFRFFKVLPTFMPDKKKQTNLKEHEKKNPHYWEVGRKSYPKKKVFHVIERCGLEVVKHFHNPSHPYHFFIMCRVRKEND